MPVMSPSSAANMIAPSITMNDVKIFSASVSGPIHGTCEARAAVDIEDAEAKVCCVV